MPRWDTITVSKDNKILIWSLRIEKECGAKKILSKFVVK